MGGSCSRNGGHQDAVAVDATVSRANGSSATNKQSLSVLGAATTEDAARASGKEEVSTSLPASGAATPAKRSLELATSAEAKDAAGTSEANLEAAAAKPRPRTSKDEAGQEASPSKQSGTAANSGSASTTAPHDPGRAGSISTPSSSENVAPTSPNSVLPPDRKCSPTPHGHLPALVKLKPQPNPASPKVAPMPVRTSGNGSTDPQGGPKGPARAHPAAWASKPQAPPRPPAGKGAAGRAPRSSSGSKPIGGLTTAQIDAAAAASAAAALRGAMPPPPPKPQHADPHNASYHSSKDGSILEGEPGLDLNELSASLPASNFGSVRQSRVFSDQELYEHRVDLVAAANKLRVEYGLPPSRGSVASSHGRPDHSGLVRPRPSLSGATAHSLQGSTVAEEEEDDLQEFSKRDLAPSRFAVNKDGSENPHAFRSGTGTGASTPAHNSSFAKPPTGLPPHHLKPLDAAALRNKLPLLTSRLSEESHLDVMGSESQPSVVSSSSGVAQGSSNGGASGVTSGGSSAVTHAYVNEVSRSAMQAGAAGSGAAQVLTLVN